MGEERKGRAGRTGEESGGKERKEEGRVVKGRGGEDHVSEVNNPKNQNKYAQ